MKKFPQPMVDVIIEKNNKIILVKRKFEPFVGMFAIPGGQIKSGETVEEAAIREAKEETGLEIKLKEILGVYSDPKRDPRKYSIATVFIAEPITDEIENETNETLEVKWFTVDEIDTKNLAFDHGKIIEDYKKWKKEKGTYWSTK